MRTDPCVRSFRRPPPRVRLLALALALLLPAGGVQAQARVTIEQFLSPAFPYDLVTARTADRIAWLEFERGMRNVYTAAAPDFRPVRLTAWLQDDGTDLSSLQLSADGGVALFVRGHAPNRDGWIANPASDADGAERAAWAVRTEGGEPWRVVAAREPILSPDGRWVAYEKDGQIYRAPVARAEVGGARVDEPLFRAFGRNGDPVWSPDSRKIAFVSERGDHGFIGVYDTERHRVSYLAPGVDRDRSPVWSPDGRRIAFVRRPGLPFSPPEPRGRWATPETTPDTTLPDGMTRAGFAGGHTLELWVADVATGEGRAVWRTQPLDERFTSIRSLLWAGEHLLFRAEPENWTRYYSVSLTQPPPEPVELTPGEGEVEHVALAADGRWLYYTSNAGDIDRRHLWRVPVGGGRAEQLTKGQGAETHPAVLASGRGVALLGAGARQPQSVAVVDAEGGTPRVITALPAAFPRNAHVEPQNVVLTAADGTEVHAQLFVPEGIRAGERRPALLFTHGGPRRQMLLGYHYMHFYHMAYAINQYFAHQGYVVISVNYRGGIGYGKAFRQPEGLGRRGNSEYQDVVAGGRYLQSRPDVDPERIGLWGLSYGGILTAQGLARNSDIFKAGVDIAGVHMWGDPQRPDGAVFQASAVAAMDTWTSPVLLIHGDDDRNVAFSQTVGLVQLLRARGIEHELIVYPDEVHDFLVFGRWLHAFGATDDFFARHLLGRKTARAAQAQSGNKER